MATERGVFVSLSAEFIITAGRSSVMTGASGAYAGSQGTGLPRPLTNSQPNVLMLHCSALAGAGLLAGLTAAVLAVPVDA